MPHELRHLTTLDDARKILWEALPARIREGRFGGRPMPIAEAVGFALDEDVVCPTDLPPFDRSTMDGYAVRAADTFGASEGLPAYLKVVGEVRMGEEPHFSLAHQQAAAIPTGGMLPGSADAVVMVEHTQPWGNVGQERAPAHYVIEVLRPVAPGDNIVRRGDDARTGDALLRSGHHLRPQDISALAGLGIGTVRVRRPRVAVLSTGSELVTHDQPIAPGQIRDMNGPALQAAVRAVGAEPVPLGIVPDDPAVIRVALQKGRAEADIVLVSGGTSVGMEDVIHDLIDSLGPPGVLVHGLAMKPGKPVVIGLVNEVPVFGMPGHPTSCLVIFRELVAPLLGGSLLLPHASPRLRLPLKARLTRNYPSQAGREELVPMRVEQRDGAWEATPLLGPSAFISTLVAADGLVRIPAAAEGLYAGDKVEVEPFE
jgi:molybdopterin molybdotransferase